MYSDNELVDIIKSFKSGVKSLNYDMINNTTDIKLENGKSYQLIGKHMELQEHISINNNKCSFCGAQPHEPLFTIYDNVYICKECCILAITTYLKNGYEVDLNLSNSFPDLIKN